MTRSLRTRLKALEDQLGTHEERMPVWPGGPAVTLSVLRAILPLVMGNSVGPGFVPPPESETAEDHRGRNR